MEFDVVAQSLVSCIPTSDVEIASTGAIHSQGAWRHRNWLRVVFSDESRFQLFRADGRQRVYRRIGERYSRPCVRQVDRFGDDSVMVWGAIRFGWRSQLRIIDGNLTANR